LRGQIQAASGPLQSSEQFGLGGAGSVRGFAEHAAAGDRGWLFSSEFQFPTIGVLGPLTGAAEAADQLRFHLFLDAGRVSNLSDIPGTPRSQGLVSAGAGFRYALPPHASLNVDYGVQLTRAPAGTTRNGMLHLAVVVGF